MPRAIDESILSDNEREAWKCDSCNALIYNVDKKGRPAPGAPSSYFGGTYGGKRYERVCTLCYEIKKVLEDRGDYWRSVQTQEDTIRNQRLQKHRENGGGLI